MELTVSWAHLHEILEILEVIANKPHFSNEEVLLGSFEPEYWMLIACVT